MCVHTHARVLYVLLLEASGLGTSGSYICIPNREARASGDHELPRAEKEV